ncbi:LytR/AlgR family response regulator transcription factor [Pedobacter alpinus]|uniref:LytR/AlgR family response regulator transcription factor n=1 Tax=Pedobacter alpinus TaxID=1590643 RepID=A0ABW5TT83_9SPHI
MVKIKAIIVDDEENARLLLQSFITEFCENIELVGLASDVKTAVKLINNNEVDLVFLDIEMPNENGFALFEYFEKPSFKTIFCTAYSEYALKAFEVSAVDYILKPIGIKKLQEAVEKLNEFKLPNHQVGEVLKENLFNNKIKKIGLHLGDATVFFNLEDIYYFEADGSYTYMVHKNGRELVVKKIKHFEGLLGIDIGFFRIHRSYLINLIHIKKYTKKEGLSVVLADDKTLAISRERKEDFEQFLKVSNFQ